MLSEILCHREIRRFLIAWTISAVGSGAAYIAVLLLARQRFDDPWLVSAVLLAEFAPAMILGAKLGALVDRHSPRSCAIAADALAAGAFLGMVGASSPPVLVAFSGVAGVAAALAVPAHMALLPRLAAPDGLPSATAAYGVIEEVGYTAGPLLAAVAFSVTSPTMLLAINAASFGCSMLLIGSLPLGSPAGADRAAVAEIGDGVAAGVRVLRSLPGIPITLAATCLAVMATGLANVGEVLYVTGDLGAGPSGLALISTCLSVGMVLGALTRAADVATYRLRLVVGLGAMGGGLVLAAATPSIPIVLVAFVVAGYGNGAAIAHERLLLQDQIPDVAMGRVFGARKLLHAWAFCIAYAGSGVLAHAGGRPLLICAGTLAAIATAVAASGLLRLPARPTVEPA